jgi:hypothetical protein
MFKMSEFRFRSLVACYCVFNSIFFFIGNLDIFALISPSDIISINLVTLIMVYHFWPNYFSKLHQFKAFVGLSDCRTIGPSDYRTGGLSDYSYGPVFIGFKRHNVTSHRSIFSIIRVTKLILIISLGEIKAKISKLPIKKKYCWTHSNRQPVTWI